MLSPADAPSDRPLSAGFDPPIRIRHPSSAGPTRILSPPAFSAGLTCRPATLLFFHRVDCFQSTLLFSPPRPLHPPVHSGDLSANHLPIFPLKDPRKLSLPQKASQALPLAGGKNFKPFSLATCAREKILLSLQVWNLCAAGAQIMRAADCNPFVEKSSDFSTRM